MAKGKERTSAKLRTTLRICELVGVKYDKVHYKFGGFFDTFQLEQIVKKLEELDGEKK